MNGITDFSHAYTGELTTETMLIRDINDHNEELSRIADFIANLKPDKSYLSIPTRPPAEISVRPSNENSINKAYQIFSDKSMNAEYLIGFEGDAFSFTENIEADLLSITAVHPMREDSVKVFLKKSNGDWAIIEKLIQQGKLTETKYEGKRFYMRKFPTSILHSMT